MRYAPVLRKVKLALNKEDTEAVRLTLKYERDSLAMDMGICFVAWIATLEVGLVVEEII